MAKLLTLLWLILGTAFAGSFMLLVLALPAATLSLAHLPWAALAGFAVAMPTAWWIARAVESPPAVALRQI